MSYSQDIGNREMQIEDILKRFMLVILDLEKSGLANYE